MDTIHINVPTFIRLLELAREDVENDVDLHEIAEAVIMLSQDGPVTMDHYDLILSYMNLPRDDGSEDLERIKNLSRY